MIIYHHYLPLSFIVVEEFFEDRNIMSCHSDADNKLQPDLRHFKCMTCCGILILLLLKKICVPFELPTVTIRLFFALSAIVLWGLMKPVFDLLLSAL